MPRRPVIYLAFAQIIIWAATFYLFPAMLLSWEQDLLWSKTELTGAITTAILIAALCSPLVGRVIDMGYGAAMLALCTLLSCGALIALSFVTQLWQFYLVWGFIGITIAGCLYEPCFALMTRVYGAQAKQGIILLTLVAGFAGSVSFPAAHALTDMFGWRSTVQVFAAVLLFVGVPLMVAGAYGIARNDTHKTIKHISKDRAFMKLPVFWLLGGAFAIIALLHGAIINHLLPLLDESGIDAKIAVIAVSFIAPMQVTGRMAMMIAEKHLTNHLVAMFCFTIMTVSILILLAVMQTPEMLVLFIILFGGSYGVVSIIRPLIARDMLGETDFGAKSGSLAMIYMLGLGSAPYLGSLLWSKGGYGMMLICLAALALVGLGMYVLAKQINAKK